MFTPRRYRWLALLPCALVLGSCGSGAPKVVSALQGDVSMAQFTVAATNLNSWYTSHATYAGATLGVEGLTLARADASTWCIQSATQHETGPGGPVANGPC